VIGLGFGQGNFFRDPFSDCANKVKKNLLRFVTEQLANVYSMDVYIRCSHGTQRYRSLLEHS